MCFVSSSPSRKAACKRVTCSAANSKHWFTTSSGGRCRKAMLGVWFTCTLLNLQLYHQTPSAGLRHPSRCRKAMLGVWFSCNLQNLQLYHVTQHALSTAFRHLPPRKDVINQYSDFGSGVAQFSGSVGPNEKPAAILRRVRGPSAAGEVKSPSQYLCAR